MAFLEIVTKNVHNVIRFYYILYMESNETKLHKYTGIANKLCLKYVINSFGFVWVFFA